MIPLNRQQVIRALIDALGDPDVGGVTSGSQLYKPPFGFNPDSLEAFLRSAAFYNAFGFMLHVTDLDNPPTFGGLVDAILKKYNPKVTKTLSAIAPMLLAESRPKNMKAAVVKPGSK
jgi:hypothetical protein